MSAALAVALALLPQALPAEQALDEARFEDALELYDQASDPLERARGRAEVFYRVRDPQSARREARVGLALDAADLHLLYRACGASLWLADGAAAADFAVRLERAVGEANLSPGEREAWSAATSPLLAQARELLAAEESRMRAVARARAVVLAMLAMAVAALASLLTSAARQGMT